MSAPVSATARTHAPARTSRVTRPSASPHMWTGFTRSAMISRSPNPTSSANTPTLSGRKLAHVDQPRVRPPPEPGDPGPDLLVDDDGQMAAVQREQRQQVEQADEDVQRDDDEQHDRDLGLPADLGRERLAGVLPAPTTLVTLPPAVAAPVLRRTAREWPSGCCRGPHRANDHLGRTRARVGDPADRAHRRVQHRRGNAEVGALAPVTTASEDAGSARWPFRSTMTVTGVPGFCARIAAPSWFQVCTRGRRAR